MSLNAVVAGYLAESLIAVAEVSDYLSDRSAHPAAAAWSALETEQKEGCCRQASDDLSRFVYCREPLHLPGLPPPHFPLPFSGHRILGGKLASCASATVMADDSLEDCANLYPDDYFVGGAIAVIDGPCTAQMRRITNYTAATGEFRVEAFSTSPGAVNYLLIWPLPAWAFRAAIEQAASIALLGRNSDTMRDAQKGLRSISSPGRTSSYSSSGAQGHLCPEAWSEIRPYIAGSLKFERS